MNINIGVMGKEGESRDLESASTGKLYRSRGAPLINFILTYPSLVLRPKQKRDSLKIRAVKAQSCFSSDISRGERLGIQFCEQRVKSGEARAGGGQSEN